MEIWPGAPPIVNQLLSAVIIAICTVILNFVTQKVTTGRRIRTIENDLKRILDRPRR